MKRIPQLPNNDIPEFEALEILRKASADSLYNRQTYEWKMSITVWTPLVAFIGIVLTYPQVWVPTKYLYTSFLILIMIHILWQRNLMAANDRDSSKRLECEQKMRKSLGLPESKPPKSILYFRGWAHATYILITLGLIVLAGVLNGTKRNHIVILPNDVNEWLERTPGIQSKKDEYVAEILRKEKTVQDTRRQNVNPNISSTVEEAQPKK